MRQDPTINGMIQQDMTEYGRIQNICLFAL